MDKKLYLETKDFLKKVLAEISTNEETLESGTALIMTVYENGVAAATEGADYLKELLAGYTSLGKKQQELLKGFQKAELKEEILADGDPKYVKTNFDLYKNCIGSIVNDLLTAANEFYYNSEPVLRKNAKIAQMYMHGRSMNASVRNVGWAKFDDTQKREKFVSKYRKDLEQYTAIYKNAKAAAVAAGTVPESKSNAHLKVTCGNTSLISNIVRKIKEFYTT